MLKGQDIVVLLALAGRPPVTMRETAARIAFDPAGVTRSLRRLTEAGLYSRERDAVLLPQAEEFLVHGLRYVFPARMAGESRGLATAWAAPPLDGEFGETASLPPVWMHPEGTVRGIALEPLHEIVPAAALADARTWRLLALVDAFRVGDARVRGVARGHLHDELRRG
ncbi:helix-turn-helix domain-containing protein [Conexibacter stalactiti]|uniref:Helix-turn-helix domain-containing protein n=1 Tax=Conexibacter stalactiti TaxID=1940611 RepID=A0ABU4HL35_9ACTN|nr:helix-turn-helix domain-containing protein [Conexibacter stalactiti]MDW5594013.1 helix-turn-helix domain-containing protein [Conexibacter stalactiti]MEC5034655.1 helix-turn-helix domain-containing protein [Conexibacter stalactiti]